MILTRVKKTKKKEAKMRYSSLVMIAYLSQAVYDYFVSIHVVYKLPVMENGVAT